MADALASVEGVHTNWGGNAEDEDSPSRKRYATADNRSRRNVSGRGAL